MKNEIQATSSKLFIGFITYGESSFKYLPFFLESLFTQSYKDFSVVALDNSENFNKNSDYIIDKYPQIKLLKSDKNIGFARAYNKMIGEASKNGADYFLALNPDTLLEKDMLEKMLLFIEKNDSLGSLSPRVMSWDFKNKKKTDIIDTCGIELSSALSFSDIGQGEKYFEDRKIKILGPSGAVALYRMSALEKVSENGQYFDELMFMYKEDCDLAYRLYLAGFKSDCIKDAVVYHDRTAKKTGGLMDTFKTRRAKSRKIREWSFLNQHIIYFKYFQKQKVLDKLFVIWSILKIFVFVIIFEQFLLKQYLKLFKIRKKIKLY